MYWVYLSSFGNDLLVELAIKGLKKKKLGKDDNTDFLTVSFHLPIM
jgi:hypothetical protein